MPAVNIDRKAFARLAARPDLEKLKEVVRDARRNDRAAREEMLGALTWVAFSCPGATDPVYDLIATTWLDVADAPIPEIEPGIAEAPLGAAFWDAYWQVIAGAEEGYDASTITAAVASLGGALDECFGEIAEELARQHPGADKPTGKNVPGLIDVPGLASCPEQSLGKRLYDLLTINGFDAEVLDRNAIMLGELPPALRYLNTRILQMHDVWHLVGGYTTDAMHEVAISAFQLAQFGHNYSSMFLAAAGRMTHERNAAGFGIFFQTVAEAWLHGRENPSFMAIEWEELFDLPVEEIRSRYGITAYRSRVPADLVETLQDGSLLKKVKAVWQVMKLNRDLQRFPKPVAA